MKKLILSIIIFVSLFGCKVYGQEIPDSTKSRIIIEYISSVQSQIKEARKAITIGDGEAIVKNNAWSELLYLMIEDLKKRRVQ